jgi:hypothetical protein
MIMFWLDGTSRVLLNRGLVFFGPGQSDRSGGPVWPVWGVTTSFTVSTASFWMVGIYTPWPSLSRAAGSLGISELLEAFSWPASSPQHSLWVVLYRLHIHWLGWEIECVRVKWPLWELHFEQLRATIAFRQGLNSHLLLLEVSLLDS